MACVDFFPSITVTLSKILPVPGLSLQIQCYQCEEFQLNNDCSAPEFIVNCTVNVQDMCQKEVMEKSFGKNLIIILLFNLCWVVFVALGSTHLLSSATDESVIPT